MSLMLTQLMGIQELSQLVLHRVFNWHGLKFNTKVPVIKFTILKSLHKNVLRFLQAVSHCQSKVGRPTCYG
jgi:hypothetical protein